MTMTWADSDGVERPIPCDWQRCDAGGVQYVRLDSPIGPYDKAMLCAEHLKEWRRQGSGRQANLAQGNFR